MACNLATVQAAACDSGIGKLTDPIRLLQVIAQTRANTLQAANPALSTDVDEILSRACTSGIGRQTNPYSLLRLIAQNLCAQISPETPVATCDTVTISGAGSEIANQSYTKTSATLYTGVSSTSSQISYNSGTGLWSIIGFVEGVLYTQTGTFPTNWTAVNGANPTPTGVCS